MLDYEDNLDDLRDSIEHNLSNLNKKQRIEFVLKLIQELDTSHSITEIMNCLDETRYYVL